MNILYLLEKQKILINLKLHKNSQHYLTDDTNQLLQEHTSFLHTSASFRDRILTILLKLDFQPTCATCNSPIFPKLRNTKLIVPIYCSRKCVNNFISRDKRNVTIKDKYGVDHPLRIPMFVEKQKQTTQRLYGVDNVAQSDKIKHSKQQTNLERYGYANPQQNETVRKKYKQTCLEKYGHECSLQNEQIKQKGKQTCLEKYGTQHPTQNVNVFNSIKETMRNKYGVEFFHQKHIPTEILNLLKDGSFLKEQHCNLKMTQSQIADQLCVSQAVISRYFKKHKIETRHFFKSSGESSLATFVESLGLNVEYNVRNIIYPLEIDVYVPEIKLGLEFNGTYWHTEERGRGEQYHNNKTIGCLEQGVILLHVSEEEWNNQRELVEDTIKRTVEQLLTHPI